MIAAERRRETVEQLIQRVLDTAGDQDAALSAIGLAELVHGIYRADSPDRRVRRENVHRGACRGNACVSFTVAAARLAGRIDAEQQAQHVVIPLGDLLIGPPHSRSVISLAQRTFGIFVWCRGSARADLNRPGAAQAPEQSVTDTTSVLAANEAVN